VGVIKEGVVSDEITKPMMQKCRAKKDEVKNQLKEIERWTKKMNQ